MTDPNRPIRKGALLLGLVCLLSTSAAEARAVPPEVLTLCVEDLVRARPAAAALQRGLGRTRLELARRRGTRCDGAGVRAWFERRRGAVVLVLQGPKARAPLVRRVVWLDSPRHGLSRLAARGRLSSFSVLLLALLAEHRLGPLGPAPAVRPGRPSAAAPTPPAASMPTAASPLSRASPPSAGSPPSTPSTQPAVPDTEATETVARAEPVAADPEPGALSAPAPASAPVAVSDGRPRPPRQPRRAHPPPRGQPAPRLSRSGLRNGLLDQLGVSVQVAGSLRNAGLLAPEVGVALRWRSAVVEAGYQAPVRWSLEGREIEVQTVLVGAGWAPRLWQRGRVRVNGKLGMVGERVVLQRQDLERTAARDHAFWDLGAVLGTSLQVRLAGGLSAGLALEGVWFPAGHEIRIPLGPSARLNQLALRLGLRVAWGGRGDPAGQVL